MLHLKELVLFLLTCLLSFEIVVWAGNEDTKPMGEPLRFETPKMTEEEQHSQHMPANLICDACTAVAYQLTKALEKEEKKRNGKELKESDYLDIIERVCEGKTYENYGLKTVNGKNRISGEGLEAADQPGMLQGGGKWPGRMAQKCGAIVEQVGEDDLYKEYRKRKTLFRYLCKEVSKDCKDKKDEL